MKMLMTTGARNGDAEKEPNGIKKHAGIIEKSVQRVRKGFLGGWPLQLGQTDKNNAHELGPECRLGLNALILGRTGTFLYSGFFVSLI